MSTKNVSRAVVALAANQPRIKGEVRIRPLERAVNGSPLISVLDRQSLIKQLGERPRSRARHRAHQAVVRQPRHSREDESPLFVVVNPRAPLSHIPRDAMEALLPQAIEMALIQLLMQQQIENQALLRDSLWSALNSVFSKTDASTTAQGDVSMKPTVQSGGQSDNTAVKDKPRFNVATAAQLRDQVIQSAQWLTAQEIAENAGFRTVNPSSQPNKWKCRGHIFAISDQGRDKFPAYALGVDGRPLPIMKEILAVFADKRQPLSIATWFAAANSWLRGKAPKDVVAEHGADVLFAAQMEVLPIEHG